MTKIEWTHRPGTVPKTWNPVVGCPVISPGCRICYAMKQAARLLDGNPKTPHYAGTTKLVNGRAVWTGKVALAPDHKLYEPLRWKKPATVFVDSMGDLFHEKVPDAWIDIAFAVMALSPQHTFIVLTKRAARMREYMWTPGRKRLTASRVLEISESLARLAGSYKARIQDEHFERCFAGCGPFPNVELGVSVEDQRHAEERIPDLLATPAAVRVVSVEPMLGRVDLRRISIWGSTPVDDTEQCGLLDALTGYRSWHDGNTKEFLHSKIDQVMCGGESGPDASTLHPNHPRFLRDQCEEAGTPFYFKQWGEWLPWEPGPAPYFRSQNNQTADKSALFPDDMDEDPCWDDGLGYVADGESHAAFQKVGKKAAGRLLDGREWTGFPRTVGAPL